MREYRSMKALAMPSSSETGRADAVRDMALREIAEDPR